MCENPDAVSRSAQVFLTAHQDELGRATSCAEPVLVQAADPARLQATPGLSSFWRVPLTSEGRHVGFLDVALDGRVVRYGLLADGPARETALTEMTTAEVREQVRASLGPEYVARGEPEMVFLGAETRVAWRVRVVDRHGRDGVAVVTPGQAWLGSP